MIKFGLHPAEIEPQPKEIFNKQFCHAVYDIQRFETKQDRKMTKGANKSIEIIEATKFLTKR